MNLFGTAGIRGSVAEEVTPSLAVQVGRAVARHARESTPREHHEYDDTRGPETPTVVVGRDGRTTGDALAAAVTAGLAAGGCTVRRVGRVPTPALAYAARGRRGVMLTASHNPPADNGIKLFVDGTEYGADAERAIEERVADEASADWAEWGTADRLDVLDDYRDAVVEYARSVSLVSPGVSDGDRATEKGTDPTDSPTDGATEPADGVRVAVDCGNGMASVATPQVLRSLGASVVALNANVDGRFPGRESKPTAESLADLRRFVADDGAAVGIGHDGDADRIVLVDGDGEVVHEDTVLAILAEAYTRAAVRTDDDGPATRGGETDDPASADDPDGDRRPTVVTTPNASDRIDERVTAAGGRVERVALGYLHDGVDAVRASGGRVAFAAEPWKHIHPRFGPWIDGVASAAVLTRLIGTVGLDTLREPVTERPYRKESVACPDTAKSDAMARLEATLPDAFPEAGVETEYGVRLSFPDNAWLLVRPSGTEPYLRVYAESETVDALLDEATAVVRDAVDG